MRRVIHHLGELFGVAFLLAVGFYSAILLMLGGLVAIWGLAGGMVVLLIVGLWLRSSWIRSAQSYRVLSDLWLVALVPAALLTLLAFQLRGPIRMRAWDAHGMGASGEKANVLLLPWLHAAFFLTFALLWMRPVRRLG